MDTGRDWPMKGQFPNLWNIWFQIRIFDPYIHGVRSQYLKTGPSSMGFWNWTFIPSPCGFPHLTKNASLRVISANNYFSTINTSAYKFSALQNCGSSGKVQKVQSSFKFALEMISLPDICFQPIFDNFIKISFYSLSLECYISFLLLLWISAEGLFLCSPIISTVMCKWLCITVVTKYGLKAQR